MRQIRALILTLIAIFIISSQLPAQTFGFKTPKSYKAGDFSLKKPFNVVSNPSSRTESIMSKRISKLLRAKGATVTESNGLSARNIKLLECDKIDGAPEKEKDVFSISVYKNTIEIRYTSPKSMRWAYTKFNQLYYDKGGVLSSNASGLIKGGTVCQWSGVDAGGLFIDMTVEYKSISDLTKEMDAAIQRNISTIYLSFISPSRWCIESKTLKLVNPIEDICQGEGYSMMDLKVIYDYSQREGIEIVPVLDFSSENNNIFKKYTGHNIHTLEGQRFTKAFTNEFCQQCEFDRISFGGKIEEKREKEYITPLIDIVKSYSKDAIIIELKK